MPQYTEKEIWTEVINSYRQIVAQRYEFENLHQNFNLPPSFTEERLANFRNYFLEYLYPTAHKREELNAAFESLSKYLNRPEKLIRILLDSSTIVLKNGLHLAPMAKAGLAALKSFKTAQNFENRLVKNAILFELDPPFNKSDIDYLIGTLKLSEIEEFIQGSENLFNILHNRSLVRRIIEMIEELIAKMQQNPQTYSALEISGLQTGGEIISRGNALFEDLDETEQALIFTETIKIERKVLEDIFGN